MAMQASTALPKGETARLEAERRRQNLRQFHCGQAARLGVAGFRASTIVERTDANVATAKSSPPRKHLIRKGCSWRTEVRIRRGRVRSSGWGVGRK